MSIDVGDHTICSSAKLTLPVHISLCQVFALFSILTVVFQNSKKMVVELFIKKLDYILH